MDTIRCPMCGKPNSDDQDVCQFCQARLKPLVISQPPEPQAEEPSSPPSSTESTAGLKKPSEQPPSLPDWLQPDWLQSLRQGEPTRDLSGATGEPEPEWVDADASENFDAEWTEGAKEEDEQDENQPPPILEEAATTDWLTSLRPRSHVERERLEPDPKPEWVSPIVPEQNEPQPAESTEPETPDWLKRVRDRQQAEEPQTPPPVPDLEATLFMDEIRAKPGEEEKSPTEPLDPAQIQRRLDEEVEIPEWLADMGDLPQDDELPDLPDWLKAEETPTEEVPEAFPTPLEFEPIFPDSATPLEETPAWLSTLEENAPILSGEQPPAADERQPIDDSWLDEFPIGQELTSQPESPAGEDIRSVAPFTLDDESDDLAGEEMPDWLVGVSPPDVSDAQAGTAPGEEELQPADLPTWLEAMRPVEAAAPSAPIPDERERAIESSGPLAGLRGILPAEPDVARTKKPLTYSIKLQVTEGQQTNIAILADLIKSEGIPKAIPRPPAISSQMVHRLAVFLLLVAAILWPILSGDMAVPAPELAPAVLDARSILNSIPNGGTVLLAVDYQPGFSGEMEAASSGLMDNLMIKGAYLTLVSTTPTGPAQAERLVRSVNQQMGHHYLDVNQYTNLGYIAGGLNGIRSFASTPRRVMPFDLQANEVWTATRLSGVAQLSDMSLVVVITESPETARNWIEQAGPLLGSTPLLLVTSAQADPMLQPYYASNPRQVQGMIAGLSGGMAYESTMPRTGQARRSWDAYSYGLPMAILIILFGSLLSVVLAYLPTLRRSKGEAKP